jgi:hypothetical protein
MKRRDFLRLGVTMPAAFAARGVRGQMNTITRAAVVIGVDRPENLPPLHAAASGANKVGDWLESEGFEVQRFTDDAKPVKAGDIFDAINGFINLGTLQQLIVYFAGHGCFVGAGEYWLLSKALHNPNEAVSVNECLNLSRLCGIPNVVLISDACRSTSASLGVQELHGYVIFPIMNNRNVFTYLDRFLAARIGAPAYEVKDTAGKYHGIYTSCFLDAYSDPDDSMIEEINDFSVVTNKKLEDFLLSEVPRRAQISNVQEYPDSVVTSRNYIGRVRRHAACACGGCFGGGGCGGCYPRPKPKVVIRFTIRDLSEFELSRLGLHIRNTASKKSSAAARKKIADETGFAATRASILNARGPNVFKYGTGINIFGARLRTTLSVNMEAQILVQGDGSREPAIVQIDPRGKRQDGVVLEFEDGSGTVIAAVQRYVAKVLVEGGGVVSVSYAPAQIGDQLRTSRSDYQRADQLHALVATSAKFGVFRIDGPSEIRNSNAEQLANAIRAQKPVDLTLAIYAAYAYADAGLSEQIRSLHEIMKSQLGIDLFDVAMLSGALSAGELAKAQAPFCPMLSQGWEFLRVKNVVLPGQFANARNHILPALWTTFDREGMSIVKNSFSFRTLR